MRHNKSFKKKNIDLENDSEKERYFEFSEEDLKELSLLNSALISTYLFIISDNNSRLGVFLWMLIMFSNLLDSISIILCLLIYMIGKSIPFSLKSFWAFIELPLIFSSISSNIIIQSG